MSGDDRDEVENHDPYFEPLVQLSKIEVKTLEEDEEEFVKLRAKLFRYVSESECPEWKERGTGEVKILQHKENKLCRVLMRRDKTHKICANHYVLPHMELKPNCGSDRAWVWSTAADFADEEAKPELLAIRFANVENAQKYKTAFERAKQEMEKHIQGEIGKAKKKEEKVTEETKTEKESSKSEEDVTSQLKELTVKDSEKETADKTDCSNSADKKGEEGGSKGGGGEEGKATGEKDTQSSSKE